MNTIRNNGMSCGSSIKAPCNVPIVCKVCEIGKFNDQLGQYSCKTCQTGQYERTRSRVDGVLGIEEGVSVKIE